MNRVVGFECKVCNYVDYLIIYVSVESPDDVILFSLMASVRFILTFRATFMNVTRDVRVFSAFQSTSQDHFFLQVKLSRFRVDMFVFILFPLLLET